MLRFRNTTIAVGAVTLFVRSASIASLPAYRFVIFEPVNTTTDPINQFGDTYAPFRGPTQAFGLSDNGVVCGVAATDVFVDANPFEPTPVHRAFVWQSSPVIPSLGDEQLTYLAISGDFDNVPLDADRWSAAFDVNEDGDVVGDVQRTPAGSVVQPDAFLYAHKPGITGATPGLMTRLFGTGVTNSGARSVAERVSAPGVGVFDLAIVGMAQSSGAVGAGTSLGDLYLQYPSPVPLTTDGLRWDLSSAALTPFPGSIWSGAFGINPSAIQTSSVERIAGFSLTQLTGSILCTGNQTFTPTVWNDGALAIPVDYPLVDGVDAWLNAFVYDVSDDLTAVGVAERGDGLGCEAVAVRWLEPQPNDPVNFQVLPRSPIDANNATAAYATNAHQMIVGADTFALRALLWVGEPPVALTLDSLVNFGASNLVGFTEATDVNADGWITASASAQLSPGSIVELGVLLIPFEACPEDIDEDGDVDAVDLALVQTSTGLCESNQICHADVDGDYDVDFDDLARVMRRMKQGGCSGTTLSLEFAQTWLAVGGVEYLDTQGAAASVEAAIDPDSEIATFVNLLQLIGGAE